MNTEYTEHTEHTPFLYDYQFAAVRKMRNGCILNGGVGSGKSRTGLYYYFKEQGGSIDPDYIPMKNPKDLYIITTARKRDTLEWGDELAPFLMSTNPEASKYGKDHKVIVDSWNNIAKYTDVQGAFFIFDEQRVVGTGAWTKTFWKITKVNDWILLSATPGDTWADYYPVFRANGYFRTKREFDEAHVVYDRYAKYPKILRYRDTLRLERLRSRILVDMDFDRKTVQHHEDVIVEYDNALYKQTTKTRWDPYKDEPIMNASGLCYIWRRIVNSHPSRGEAVLEITKQHPKVIIFYNFDYERNILLNLNYGEDTEVAEWSGHAHQPIPDSVRWVYIVQYTAGCDGWNCIKTNVTVFYSQNYSYKVMEQATGRIDRLNTPYADLYYYHLRSRSPIDLAIARALKEKKIFNVGRFVKW